MKRKAISALAVGAVLLAAGPSLATYTIPVDALTEGGGTGSGGQYVLTFTTGQASPVGLSGAGAYTLSAGLLSTLLPDVMPPLLSHQPYELVSARVQVDIEITVSDDKTGVDTVSLYYREGGRSAWRDRPMQPAGDDLFTCNIPAAAVTEKGLVYYVEAADQAGNVSRYPAGAPDSVVSLRVWFTELKSAFELPAGQYRMISLPGSANGDPDSILVDDFSPYDKAVWRLGRWNAPDTGCAGTCYDEYPQIEDFYPGRAFWLISKQQKYFDFSGMSTDIARPFSVHLEKGWNQIATPFAFATDWLSAELEYDGSIFTIGQQHTVGSDTIYVEDNLISYDGSYHGLESALEPWAGYWVYNAGTVEVSLLVYPQAAGAVLNASPRLPYGPETMTALYGITVKSKEFVGQTGLAGMSRLASDGWDVMDHRQPPPITDHLIAVFSKTAWGRYSGTYMSDIRAANEGGSTWDFSVQAPKPTGVTLDIEQLVPGPENWKIVLYDIQAGMKLSPSDLPYDLRMDDERRFVLVAGTEDYIVGHQNSSGISLRAQVVSVSPNPFSDAAEIAFFVPARTPARLVVFSVQGRLVSVLADREFDAGVHRSTWQGTSHDQSRVAPGIYFLRLEVPGKVETRKILLVR